MTNPIPEGWHSVTCPSNGITAEWCRSHDRGDLAQKPPAQPLRSPRQPAPVRIGKTQASSAQLRSEDPVFLDQIRHRLLPLVAPPARKSHQHELKCRALHHRGSLHERHRPTIDTEASVEKWDTTGPFAPVSDQQ
jgi:hypothetical protein